MKINLNIIGCMQIFININKSQTGAGIGWEETEDGGKERNRNLQIHPVLVVFKTKYTTGSKDIFECPLTFSMWPGGCSLRSTVQEPLWGYQINCTILWILVHLLFWMASCCFYLHAWHFSNRISIQSLEEASDNWHFCSSQEAVIEGFIFLCITTFVGCIHHKINIKINQLTLTALRKIQLISHK